MARSYDIVAATECPTGIARTFMAKEALETAAAERELSIEVETHEQCLASESLDASEGAPTPAQEGFVKAEHVHLGQSFSSRDEVLSFISNEAVKSGIATDADALMEAFLAREGEGSTGMMDGFAIPHAKSEAVSVAAVSVVKDDSGVGEWETMDGEPVNVAIALLIPETQAGTTHLKLLSKVAKALMDESFRAAVKSADDASAIAAAINERLD